MGEVLLLFVVALTVAAVVFGVTVLVSGRDQGLAPAEPDGRAVPLPGSRPLRESDVAEARFDTALRGYRMAQVDQAMRRAAYDIGYKSELISVLEAEVLALREGRTADADALRHAREAAAGASPAADTPTDAASPAGDAPTDAASPAGDAPAEALDAEAGVAAAPAAAAVEDEAVLPTPAPATPAGEVAPVAAPVDQEPADREIPLRPLADPTSSPAAGAPGTDPAREVGRPAQGPAATDGGDGERERGAVVRSELA